ncbi:lipocalin-like domain-containing protein [Roseomonas sp. GCM10028921]
MNSLVGTWRLVEALAFDENGREAPPPLGPNPMGIIIYDTKRMMVAVCDGRPAMPEGSTQRIFSSYAGNYEFDGEKLVVQVDGASSQENHAEQVRQITFENPNRYVAVPLTPTLGRSSGLKLTWERVG